MALKRWHRAGLTVAGMALSAAVALPPRPLPEPGELGSILFPAEPTWSEGPRFERTLSGTVGGLRILVRAAHLADSLFALAVGPRALHSADRALTVIYTPPVSSESARVWLGMLERELALVPRGAGSGMPLIVRLRKSGRSPSVALRWRDWHWMRFVSPRPERPACLVDVQLPGFEIQTAERIGLVRGDDRSGALRTRVLGWCSLYARFGTPGPRVGRWAGVRAEAFFWWSRGPDLGSILDVHRRGRAHHELATWWWEKLSGACSRSGGPCLRMVELVADPTDRWEGASGVRRNSLLAGLVLQDPARFERFWRSSDAPAAAIERAYGRPVGTIIADWRRGIVAGDLGEPAGLTDLSAIGHIDAAMYGPEPGGPRIPADALLSSLGWAVLAIGLGILVAKRQQVR